MAQVVGMGGTNEKVLTGDVRKSLEGGRKSLYDQEGGAACSRTLLEEFQRKN